ncbi:hypothetical protein ACTG5S_06455 [Pasteurella multocida]|nr:hypothetical protein E5U06_07440 [Pasteurella multocida]TAA80810.1 hypothetical protein PMCND_01750 [Pasteurella multocida]TAA90463.1 hypothetical protein PMCNA_02190 [Pasteurella multocida]HDX1105578.1 hypothetical protein [Pasteurella multocida]HDX1111682.1 hypothetical protein [Pasteurella multocida]
MVRVRKKGDKTLSYSIEPHPKGLGFVVYEQFGKSKTCWQRNFASKDLCETAIKQWQKSREEFLNASCKPARQFYI